ncbi:TPA: hypothetical protein ACOELY_000480 [Enterobacter kobei]|uniref:hypothetical protein n=1 Tax=Enterobacter kobei TaxID=208224 RepID=UPI002B0AD360|nr:hypothetical protein [Enterobacter kobei]
MKPSYEELEEQLNRSRRLCDAALANERVWETTMMEACGEDGPASVAAEIKALRAQRDTAMESLRQQLSALAAELSAVKDAVIARIKLHEEIRKAGRPPHTDFWHQSIYMADKKVDDALNLTPNHDAFLAEVRAQGVEMFAAVLRRKGDDAFFDAIAEAQANAADQFAAQLRKGVQS